MESLVQFTQKQLEQSTKASESQCEKVAERIVEEVNRICRESDRIQRTGEVGKWQKNLSEHRIRQCLNYYQLGSKRGRVELQSTLSAIVYRYISLRQGISSYQAKVNLIEDFLQGFYAETLNAFRREADVLPTYSPRSLLELSEYMAFTERYAKRRITFSRGRSQQLVILRAQTFSQQQPLETSVDITAAEGSFNRDDKEWEGVAMQQLRTYMAAQGDDHELTDRNLRETVAQELIRYLEEKQQLDCIDYFVLRLRDCATSEIESVLGLTPRQRDYLQQRFKYHLIRFALSNNWELVHQWLGATLEQNLGLTPSQWEHLLAEISEPQQKLLELKQLGWEHKEIAKELTLTSSQTDKLWGKLLELAWDLRNKPLT
ncbi:heterocyst differentiation protein HetZ [[Leptolyngbya] sp. PCC 7376]|uniref:heterocyst differentiation protein HetZ n=1 Tax=[Leptolyngbya] sp. PCC 7376 TaxID=111781 RepID=UPI0003189D20|nr:heterocyst differentiation protein HetZ [[Leptolyngbya] sp. PCC 7376]